MQELSIIAAVARNLAIGYRNRLIYWLPNDLKRFKSLTVGNTLIMGSNTFRSLPKGALPHRRNIVLSRQCSDFPGAECFSSLTEALLHCSVEEKVFIIGGESLYRQALPLATHLYLTEVDDTPSQADAFFPSWDKSSWILQNMVACPKDERHDFSYCFADYKRK